MKVLANAISRNQRHDAINVALSSLDHQIESLHDSEIDEGVDVTAGDNEALREASLNGHESVVKVLVEHGADVTAQDNYALRIASMCGYLDVVKYLVGAGADVTAKNSYALKYAKNNKIVKYLLKNGAKYD